MSDPLPPPATHPPGAGREQAQELLARLRALPGLYSLVPSGAPAQRFTAQARVTLYSQQVRALNLAWALEAGGALAPGAEVAVIGGGVAGLTAAAALLQRGYAVALFERAHGLLPLQRSSALRFIHPRLYEWPAPGHEHEDAGLPLLGWRAGSAHEVGAQILAGFSPLLSRPDLMVCCDTRVALETTDGGWRVRWGTECLTVPAVVVAVGFGAEREVGEVPFRSYWDNDNLDREPVAAPPTPATPATPGSGDARSSRVFISGTGDGGLIDFVRARLSGFHHASTFQELLAVAGDPRLTEALLLADRGAGTQPHRLAESYTRLARSGLTEAVDAFLRPRLHPGRCAVLHGTGETPFAPGASLLNRFLTACILRLDRQGPSRYDPRPLCPPVRRDGAGYRVRLGSEDGPGEPFDEVIIRHGVHGALSPLGPPIEAACKGLALGQEPDPTRVPAWPQGYFSPIGPAAPRPSPSPASQPPASQPPPSRPPSSQPPPSRPPPSRPPSSQPPPSQPPPGTLVRQPTLASLDVLLARLKLDADQLERLCLVHLPEVARDFGSNMDAVARLRTLLRYASRSPELGARIVAGLRSSFPERMTAPLEALLREAR